MAFRPDKSKWPKGWSEENSPTEKATSGFAFLPEHLQPEEWEKKHMEQQNYEILRQLIAEVHENRELLDKWRGRRPEDEGALTLTREIFKDAATTEDEIKSRLGRKWRKRVAAVGAMADLFKHLTSSERITVLTLSSTTWRLLEVFKNHRNVTRAIESCKVVGLLVCVNEKYKFNGSSAYGRQYAYNKEVQSLVNSIIEAHGINIQKDRTTSRKRRKKRIKEREEEGDPVDESLSLLDRFAEEPEQTVFAVRLSSKLRIADMTDSQAVSILATKYPQIALYGALAEDMNQALPGEQRIVFKPSVTRNKGGYITHLGIRATSAICSLTKNDAKHTDFTGMSRREYLAGHFGGRKVYEYDVKSSIYRVAYLLRTGEWLDDDIDLYEWMYGRDFLDEEERKHFKDFCMRLYFDRPTALYGHIASAVKQTVGRYSLEAVHSALVEAKSNMEKVIGESIDSEIFLHESCIYLDLVHRLRNSGFNVVQVYDGFYSDKPLADICKALLPVIAEDYWRTFIATGYWRVDLPGYIERQ